MWWIVSGLVATLIAGALIHFVLPAPRKEELAKTVSILGGLIAALSLFWAAYTFSADVQLQRELAAASLYREHMQTSLQNANLANAGIAPTRPTKSNPANNDANAQLQYVKDIEQYEKYQWYVGHALYSFETMIEIVDKDPGWTNTFKDFICAHEKYIRSGDFPRDHYSDNLNALINQTSAEECLKRQKDRPAQPNL